MSRSIARCSVAQRHVNCRRTWLFVSFCRTARARARQVKRSGKASEQISSSSSSSSSSSVFVKFVHFATREQEKQPFIYSFQGFCSERREREEKRSHEDEARKRASETAAAAAAARRKEAREGSRRRRTKTMSAGAAWRKLVSTNLKELRFHFSQTSQGSKGLR